MSVKKKEKFHKTTFYLSTLSFDELEKIYIILSGYFGEIRIIADRGHYTEFYKLKKLKRIRRVRLFSYNPTCAFTISMGTGKLLLPKENESINKIITKDIEEIVLKKISFRSQYLKYLDFALFLTLFPGLFINLGIDESFLSLFYFSMILIISFISAIIFNTSAIKEVNRSQQ